MSEHLNNHEREVKPLYDDCMKCEKKYELTKENTAGFEYIKQPECNWIYCACPHCDFRTTMFLSDGSDTLERCRELGIEVARDQWASPDIYDQWCELRGIILPETHELTHRHEALIGKFATVLTDAPDEHLYDLIVDEGYNKPYPIRWA